MHCYRKTKEQDEFKNVKWLYTVGYYEPHTFRGEVNVTEYLWVPLEDTSDEYEARAMVNYLNGGAGYLFRYPGRETTK